MSFVWVMRFAFMQLKLVHTCTWIEIILKTFFNVKFYNELRSRNEMKSAISDFYYLLSGHLCNIVTFMYIYHHHPCNCKAWGETGKKHVKILNF